MVLGIKKTPATRMLFFMVCDLLFSVLAVWLAFLLRFDFIIPGAYFPSMFYMMGLLAVAVISTFYFTNLYSFSWAYVSANEGIALLRATFISFLLASVGVFVSDHFPYFTDFPRSVLVVSSVLLFMFSGGLRFSKRFYLRILKRGIISKKEKTIIVGAGDAGEQIARSIVSSSDSPYSLVGFVDDNRIKQGVLIHGLKVLGTISELPRIVAETQARQLIVALPSAGKKVIKEAVEMARKAGVKQIKITPSLADIIKGTVSVKELKGVQIEDLLGREKVKLDEKQINDFIKDKTVLITGAAGSIGSELSRRVARFGPGKLVLLDQDETGIFTIEEELKKSASGIELYSVVTDVTDREKIQKVFQETRPQIVFHAAAYKHVPLMEKSADEAVKNNVFGTQTVAQASLDAGVDSFVFISTDKAVNPTSVMGATKRLGEMICQSLSQAGKTKFMSVRFGNVLNSRGSVIPIFKEQIRKGGPIEITHQDMQRYFMLTSEACLLVLQAASMGQGGEVFVLDMGKPVKILDLARDMIRLSGFEPDKDIAIVFTEPRPGEKLFEEILGAEEGTTATKNEKIFTAILSLEKERLSELETLRQAAEKGDTLSVKNLLGKIVPYYQGQN